MVWEILKYKQHMENQDNTYNSIVRDIINLREKIISSMNDGEMKIGEGLVERGEDRLRFEYDDSDCEAKLMFNGDTIFRTGSDRTVQKLESFVRRGKEVQ